MLRFLTAGESHGKGLTVIIDGVPAGIPFSEDYLNKELKRRKKGHGRGDRMLIESDNAEITGGVRHGFTLGSPVSIFIRNKDSGNWGNIMSVNEVETSTERVVVKPRPGHADLSGMLKYNHTDARNILERASARETAARVAMGALMKSVLNELGIKVSSFVVSIGEVSMPPDELKMICETNEINSVNFDEIVDLAEASSVSCFHKDTENKMIEIIDKYKTAGDSLGGLIKIIVSGVPVGLGSHTQWDKKLDSAIAGALMSIQAIKGVEIGLGFKTASDPGSMVHDEIFYQNEKIMRKTNNAGGIEGGISNGEPILIQCAMKPIPTLYSPLATFDMTNGQPSKADVERSDACAVPAAAVVSEAMTAFVIAKFALEKFGSDNLAEIKSNLNSSKLLQNKLLP